MDNKDTRGNEFSIVPLEKIGVQERPETFGAGDTKRVYELQYKSFSS